ncbi:MAG: hypothetical protein A7316_01835 [Candidatus Altiarchaeales archaeon WOR_SM1_86-2]|nr:MAG: hypothetical protein A7316_01835 [Candidatus Altiarchaeales archaeon WOR_SM1_86-2]
MIRKLKVKNFKSLKDFEVEFGKFNVLIGRNNSGKSNIIDVLSFLGEGFRDPIEKIFIRRGGYKEVVFGGNEENDIEVEAEFELNVRKTNFLFEYYVKISGKYDVIKVVEEKVTIKKGNVLINEIPDPEWFGEMPSKFSDIFQQISTKAFEGFMNRTKEFNEKLKNEIEQLKKLPETVMENSVSVLLFARTLCQIYTYQIIPQNIKLQYPETFIDKYLALDKKCENLALFLLKLSQQDKKRFERIKGLLSGVVDDIEDISPTVEGKHVYLKVKDKNFDKYFYPESVSDGTISLLSHITIMETAKKDAVICFEEPENYIHVRLLEFLIDLMKNSDKQIILATHSPYFVDWCDPEDMVIVEKENGETKARRVKNPKKLNESLIECGMTLGESYHSDELKND